MKVIVDSFVLIVLMTYNIKIKKNNIKKDTLTRMVFLWIYWNISEHLFKKQQVYLEAS